MLLIKNKNLFYYSSKLKFTAAFLAGKLAKAVVK
jgi:hypothetical protein